MFDPVKILFVLVVAVVVLGPDKLPGTARRLGSLLSDLQRWRAMIHAEAHRVVADLPLSEELAMAKRTLERTRTMTDPRQALLRAAGVDERSSSGSSGQMTTALGDMSAIPGVVDLRATAPELLRLGADADQPCAEGLEETSSLTIEAPVVSTEHPEFD